MSRDDAFALAHQRANQHREEISRPGALDGEGFGERDRPACSAAVVDRTNPDGVFVAHNQPRTATANPNDFHPLLQQRVRDQQARHDAGLDHFSEPGTHAEVRALDQALKARDPEGQLRDPAALDDFVQVPV